MQSDRSRSDIANDNMYREASDGGCFSYNMATNNKTDISLLVHYCGAVPLKIFKYSQRSNIIEVKFCYCKKHS
jgi:hypothetical protein